MTAMKANKMLWKSYQGYLAYAIELRDSGSRLEDIPVVREFWMYFQRIFQVYLQIERLIFILNWPLGQNQSLRHLTGWLL